MCLIEMACKGASGTRRLLAAFEAAVRHQARHSGCRNQDMGPVASVTTPGRPFLGVDHDLYLRRG
jgi:hypothetical protein